MIPVCVSLCHVLLHLVLSNVIVDYYTISNSTQIATQIKCLYIIHAGTGEEIENVSDEELSLCSDIEDQDHEDKWLKIAEIQLYRSHHNMIVAESGWLNDEIINVAQSLLKNQYKMKGFQNTTLGCNLSFDIMRTEPVHPNSV